MANSGERFVFSANHVSPITELGRWYGHSDASFEQFVERYFADLAGFSPVVALNDLRAVAASRVTCHPDGDAAPSAAHPRRGVAGPLNAGSATGGAAYSSPVRRRSSPSSSVTGTRTWSVVSRSRTVTASSSSESKSTVTHHGVPTSSWRR